MVMALILIIGIIMFFGPNLLKYLLVGASSIVPNSNRMIIYYMILIVLLIVMNMIEKKCRRKKSLEVIGKVLDIISIGSVIIVLLHQSIVKVTDVLVKFMNDNENIFKGLMYVGLLLIVAGIFYFLGMWIVIKKSKRKMKKNGDTTISNTSNYD